MRLTAICRASSFSQANMAGDQERSGLSPDGSDHAMHDDTSETIELLALKSNRQDFGTTKTPYCRALVRLQSA